MLVSVLYRLLSRLLRLLVRCGVEERDLETAVLRLKGSEAQINAA